jgi:hypothetical protein
LFFDPTDADEVSLIIDKLNTRSACGVDGFRMKYLKRIKDRLIPFLVRSINECIATGVFPDSLKIARVVPVHKGGDSTDPKNYRPISVLPLFSKIFEMVVRDRLEMFLNRNGVIHRNQFGFTRKSNTTAACLNLMKRIYDSMNKKKKTACIFVDLTKAFDCVDFDILRTKLHKIGIRGSALKLLSNYLTNRKQCVIIDGTVSGVTDVSCGVPQGSVLGPILFLIYINDLFSLRLFSEQQCFADDSVLTFSANDYSDLCFQMKSDLCEFNGWLVRNRLTMNVSKTSFMIFSLRNTNTIPIDLIVWMSTIFI